MLVPVTGYPKYLVSSDGYVVGARGEVLKTDPNKTGYLRITLCRDGVTKRVFVHKLVALHFVQNCDSKPIVNHKDGNKLNNRADNLEWTTHQENLAHALDTGLRSMKGNTFMNAEQKELCRRLLEEGAKYDDVAAQVGVTYNCVALFNRKRRATTIPQGSTLQANGSGSAQPS